MFDYIKKYLCIKSLNRRSLISTYTSFTMTPPTHLSKLAAVVLTVLAVVFSLFYAIMITNPNKKLISILFIKFVGNCNLHILQIQPRSSTHNCYNKTHTLPSPNRSTLAGLHCLHFMPAKHVGNMPTHK